MSLTTTNVLDNSAAPGIAAEIFVPDQLFAGAFQPVTQPITVLTGQGVLARGTVLGQITASGKYKVSVSSASDGSQVPAAILADVADTTAGDAAGGGYLTGEFNSNALTYDASFATVAALQAAARANDIFVKIMNPGLSNANPS